ncbi:MAG: 3-hydroxyacyl-CoA dehydrogenase family protein [Pseudomonadota bacterium]
MAEINKVVVVGAGTMGAGIAGICAAAGCDVALLDLQSETAQAGIDRLGAGKRPALAEEHFERLQAGSIDDLEQHVADADWICEAIVENLQIKRDFFARVEAARKDGSLVTTNTSGIPLRDILDGMPERLQSDMAVTHFFNPPHIMRLLEFVPSEQAGPALTARIADFCGGRLGKGVVYAKDTVNFIGNRIGCYWMLSGLHIAKDMRANGIDQETVDALMSKPMGFPPTGLYGLVDLIGLDVMALVADNLKANLPDGDVGHSYAAFPSEEQGLYEAGQLGRKTGGGFYRMQKDADGNRSMETYDLGSGAWRPKREVALDSSLQELGAAMFDNSAEGEFVWRQMGGTLAYAADLVPEIADDIVNVDRAMRWGFAWAKGPYEMLDQIGPARFAERLKAEGKPVPAMLAALLASDKDSFYADDGSRYFGVDGEYHETPAE